ncbi:hypothetical protein P280DRAFT_85188 [Massarina eburnea CBS 473.64]|uniref:Uncharacterized protein n=1 Tax=Massarina eburnea CBS 473.64 TaxID=1395130 RepID=A0A6A6RVN9_9PLEO|nr:hypothetical protein P280DRAFT_85188 [Massarina eburnea CBS 473.64]
MLFSQGISVILAYRNMRGMAPSVRQTWIQVCSMLFTSAAHSVHAKMKEMTRVEDLGEKTTDKKQETPAPCYAASSP